MYEAQLPKDWAFILNDSGCCALFCATEDIYLRVKKEVLPYTPLVQEVICLDAPMGEPHSFQTAMMGHHDVEKKGCRKVCDHDIVEPLPEDLANLIYTSGTTGKPKVSFAFFFNRIVLDSILLHVAIFTLTHHGTCHNVHTREWS